VTLETACSHYLGQLDAALREHADTLAAVVIEPLVQAAPASSRTRPDFVWRA